MKRWAVIVQDVAGKVIDVEHYHTRLGAARSVERHKRWAMEVPRLVGRDKPMWTARVVRSDENMRPLIELWEREAAR